MFKLLTLLTGIIGILSCTSGNSGIEDSTENRFDTENDLLLVQYDCKTDVDDLHSVAAFATLLSNADFSDLNYHAVAGTYGTQEGLYVPPNDLFQLAFGENWTDAHADFSLAVERVKEKVMAALEQEGDIWIADAGQSDFSAALVKAIQSQNPKINTSERFHIVQHSDWNEEVTSPEALQFVKENADYHKIPDGNVLANGTPGFRDPDFMSWKEATKNQELINLWELAIGLANQYNGQEGRYLNEAIKSGGLDFSDFSEVWWILELQDIKNANEFFQSYSK